VTEDLANKDTDLKTQIAAIEKKLKETHVLEHKYSKTTWILTGVTLVVFLLIGTSIVRGMKANLMDREKGLESLRSVLLPQIQPIVEAEAQKIFQEVWPIYQQELSLRLKIAMPEFARQMEAQKDIFIETVRQDAEKQIVLAIDNALKSQGKYLEGRLGPAFNADLYDVTNKLTQTLRNDVNYIMTYILDRYLADIDVLQNRLQEFQAIEFQFVDEDDLNKQFIHHWLMLLDYEIMDK